MADGQPNGIRGRVVGVARDLCAVAGAGLVAYGVSMIYEPAGVIIGGVFLIIGAMLHAKIASA